METWFTYKALNRTGQTVRGILQAAHRSEAVTMVERMGLQPLSVTGNPGHVRKTTPFPMIVTAAMLASAATVFCALWLGERTRRTRLQDRLDQLSAPAHDADLETPPSLSRKELQREEREEKARQKAADDALKQQIAARQKRVAANRARAEKLEIQALNSAPEDAERLRGEAARLIEEARDIEAGWAEP